MENITSIENITHIKTRFYHKFTLEENKKLIKIINIIPSLIMVEDKSNIKSTLSKLGITFHDILRYLISNEEIEMIYFFYTINIYNRESILYLEVNNKIKDLKEYTITKNNFYKEFLVYYGNYEKYIKENININSKNKVIYDGYLNKDNEVIYETNYNLIEVLLLRTYRKSCSIRTQNMIKNIFSKEDIKIKEFKCDLFINGKNKKVNLKEYVEYLYNNNKNNLLKEVLEMLKK